MTLSKNKFYKVQFLSRYSKMLPGEADETGKENDPTEHGSSLTADSRSASQEILVIVVMTEDRERENACSQRESDCGYVVLPSLVSIIFQE
jgi:hypothetical protein